MSDSRPEGDGAERFFSTDKPEKKSSGHSLSLESKADSSEEVHGRCLTLRIIQRLIPCLRNKGVWDASKGDLFKGNNDAQEAKYPRILRILESKVLDVVFVASCFLSISLFLFSEGFLQESRLLWGIIHLVNAVYALGLFSQWLQILIKSKYAKTNHGYTTRDILYTLLSVFPADLIILVIYSIQDEDDNEENLTTEIETTSYYIWLIPASRLNYLLRIRSILQFFSKWENQLVIGDFGMFILRNSLLTSFLFHMLACIWHRLACEPFHLKHFLMTPDEATTDVCKVDTWIGSLKLKYNQPLLDHPNWHVLLTHYLASFYWTIVTTFGLGAGDIHATLTKSYEVAFVTFTEILAWIYLLVNVNGMLTSLFIEKEVEKEQYFVRCVAIRLYLRLSEVSKSVIEDVDRFYKYLWNKSMGILKVDLIDEMPHVMKSEVYYDVNKFMMDQMPMLKGLDPPFLMSISLHTNHKFYLKGEFLFHRNETATSMYYLVKGFLEVLGEDDNTTIATIRCGSIIGEVHLMQPYPHVATVRCGSDCDVLVLTREDFRHVLTIYPQFIPILEQRLETRLEQSGLLLALCEKHNTYHKAFRALGEFQSESSQQQQGHVSRSKMGHSFENVVKVLSKRAYGSNNVQHSVDVDDFDGLELSGAMESKLNSKQSGVQEREPKKTFEVLLADAYLALETDVARAGSLSTDLNIPRPPLVVVAPDNTTHMTLRFNQERASVNVIVGYMKYLKTASKGKYDFMWKMIVSLWAIIVFWYYPYQFAFRGTERDQDYYFHIADGIFAIDCFYDMIQLVVTPQRTFESFKDILSYRLKTVYFYFRIVSFLPIEYAFITLLTNPNGTLMPYFYLLKFNRLFNIHLVYWFLSSFEARYLLLPVFSKTFVRLGLGAFFVAHLSAISFKFVIRDIEGLTGGTYLQSFYRAMVITCHLGYGDIRSERTVELVVEVLSLVIGTLTVLWLQSKLMAFVVNQQRQRKYFQQTYYSLLGFMKQRKFPKALTSRVSDYYTLQWNAHSGALIPRDKTTIWDAPSEMIAKVSISIGYKYISRIPLFMHTRLKTQTKCCLALRHYMLPPGEVLLYPNEKARDLYIISKGFIQVVHQGKKVGVFGEGRYFGMSGLLFGINTDFMFITLTHCQVLCLSYDSFFSLVQSNERFYQEILLLSPQETDQEPRSIDPENYHTEEEGKKRIQLAYPSDEFMADHIAKSPAYETPPQEDQNYSPKGLYAFGNIFKCNKDFYFLPHGYGIKCWTTFRAITASCAACFAAMQLAFAFPPFVGFSVTLAFDMIVWLDMFIRCRTACVGPQNILITSSGAMLRHYLGGTFLMDLLSCFPADHVMYLIYFTQQDFDNMHHVISLLRLNRLLQGIYPLMANKILEKTIFPSLTLIVVLQTLPLVFMFVNIGVCFSTFPLCLYTTTGNIGNCTNQNAWILNGLKHTLYSTGVTGLYNTFDSYMVGLYWYTQTVFNFGFGDIPIGNDAANQIMVILAIFGGIFMGAYVSAKLTSCIVGEDPLKLALQEKMVLISDFLEEHRVRRTSRRRVSEVFVNQWNNTEGVTPSILFEALPPTLKTDVMKQLYGSALKMSPLFENLDGPGLRILANSLTEVYYAEGEYMMKFGDLCDDIFFISKGVVVCYNVRGDVMCQLGCGSLIGEVGPYFQCERLYSTIAVEDVCAYVIEKEAFLAFLELYPDIKSIMESCSIKHYKEATARKMGSDDVLLTIENEKQVETIENIQSINSPDQPTSGATIDIMRASGEDMTRKPLRNMAQITAEELAKPTVEKWWNIFVTFGRLARDEMGFVHIVQEANKCHFFNFSIHPASHVCGWVSFCLLMVAISCSITSYELAFCTKHSKFEIIMLIISRCMVEAFFVIRIIGNFHLAYYNDSMVLVTGVKDITKRYIRRIDGLWLDFVTTFPFYMCEYFTNVRGEYIRTVQLLRVILFVRYLRATDSSLKMNTRRVKVFKITILICFIFHFWACAWYLAACQECPITNTDNANANNQCLRGSWMQEVLLRFNTANRDSDDVTTLERYLLSLFFVANTLTFTGFSDITPGTKLEICLTLCIVFGTIFLIGYLIGEMVQCLASQVATKIQYQHKLSVLETHFVTLGVSASKIAEIRRYFKLLWCRCRGKIFFNLMQELPYTVRADVAMELYGPNIKSSRLLGKLDENLIRQICAKIRHEIYFPGSHIVRAGDVCNSMYFIKKGEVVILDGNSNIELCVEILYENECFGEVKILLPREQFRFSYVARLESEVGVLHKDDLDAVLKNHPKIFEDLKEKANKVKIRRQSIRSTTEGNEFASNVSFPGMGQN